jgi:hypothetical protein
VYEQLFEFKLLTLVVMLGTSALIGLLLSTATMGLRSLVYNFVPSIAVAFYAVGLLASEPANTLDLTAGLLFELLVLAAFIRLFADVYELTHRLTVGEARRALLWSLPLQLLLAWPVMSLDNFGIFADGSRIGFLGEAAWAKYLTYASILLSAAQAPLVARVITLQRKITVLVWGALVLNAASSVLGGSKGAIFLWILSCAALIDWRTARLRAGTLTTVVAVTSAGFVATVWFLSSVTGIEPEEFLTIAFGRFIVTNDARSMAFDLRTMATGSQDMLRETLRSPSALFGVPPKAEPMGILLYQEFFGRTDGQGANGSLMSIATYFMGSGAVLIPATVAAAVLLLITLVSRAITGALGNGCGPLFLTVTAMVCVGIYSQDILAFQVLLPIAVLLFLIVLAVRRLWSSAARAG